eukprot:jgi/Botrbrau1/19511/Bobra.0035s0011.1
MGTKDSVDERFVPLWAGSRETEEGDAAREAPRQSSAGLHSYGPDRLYWFDEAPPQLQFNKYIRSGYRAGLSPCQCVHSWFYLHNETGNIWSHLLAAAIILGLLISQNLKPWEQARWEFYGNIIPILICFCGSVLYHSLMANHTRYRTWLMLDVCGVFALLLSGTHTLLFWGLFCHPFLRTSFIVGYYGAAAGCVVAGLRARSHLQRALPMLLLVLVRAGAMLARLLLVSGSPQANWHYFYMEGLAVSGAVLNVLRVPEKWFCPNAVRGRPYLAGPFDYWLNSHQLMHIAVALALYHYHMGATCDYHHFVSLNGVCS